MSREIVLSEEMSKAIVDITMDVTKDWRKFKEAQQRAVASGEDPKTVKYPKPRKRGRRER